MICSAQNVTEQHCIPPHRGSKHARTGPSRQEPASAQGGVSSACGSICTDNANTDDGRSQSSVAGQTAFRLSPSRKSQTANGGESGDICGRPTRREHEDKRSNADGSARKARSNDPEGTTKKKPRKKPKKKRQKKSVKGSNASSQEHKQEDNDSRERKKKKSNKTKTKTKRQGSKATKHGNTARKSSGDHASANAGVALDNTETETDGSHTSHASLPFASRPPHIEADGTNALVRNSKERKKIEEALKDTSRSAPAEIAIVPCNSVEDEEQKSPHATVRQGERDSPPAQQSQSEASKIKMPQRKKSQQRQQRQQRRQRQQRKHAAQTRSGAQQQPHQRTLKAGADKAGGGIAPPANPTNMAGQNLASSNVLETAAAIASALEIVSPPPSQPTTPLPSPTSSPPPSSSSKQKKSRLVKRYPRAAAIHPEVDVSPARQEQVAADDDFNPLRASTAGQPQPPPPPPPAAAPTGSARLLEEDAVQTTTATAQSRGHATRRRKLKTTWPPVTNRRSESPDSRRHDAVSAVERCRRRPGIMDVNPTHDIHHRTSRGACDSEWCTKGIRRAQLDLNTQSISGTVRRRKEHFQLVSNAVATANLVQQIPSPSNSPLPAIRKKKERLRDKKRSRRRNDGGRPAKSVSAPPRTSAPVSPMTPAKKPNAVRRSSNWQRGAESVEKSPADRPNAPPRHDHPLQTLPLSHSKDSTGGVCLFLPHALAKRQSMNLIFSNSRGSGSVPLDGKDKRLLPPQRRRSSWHASTALQRDRRFHSNHETRTGEEDRKTELGCHDAPSTQTLHHSLHHSTCARDVLADDDNSTNGGHDEGSRYDDDFENDEAHDDFDEHDPFFAKLPSRGLFRRHSAQPLKQLYKRRHRQMYNGTEDGDSLESSLLHPARRRKHQPPRRERTNYRFRYDGPTTLALDRVYSHDLLDGDRFNAGNAGSTPLDRPRRSQRQRQQTEANRTWSEGSAATRSMSAPPAKPNRGTSKSLGGSDIDDSLHDESSYEEHGNGSGGSDCSIVSDDHLSDDEYEAKGHILKATLRPDVWVTPIRSACSTRSNSMPSRDDNACTKAGQDGDTTCRRGPVLSASPNDHLDPAFSTSDVSVMSARQSNSENADASGTPSAAVSDGAQQRDDDAFQPSTSTEEADPVRRWKIKRVWYVDHVDADEEEMVAESREELHEGLRKLFGVPPEDETKAPDNVHDGADDKDKVGVDGQAGQPFGSRHALHVPARSGNEAAASPLSRAAPGIIADGADVDDDSLGAGQAKTRSAVHANEDASANEDTNAKVSQDSWQQSPSSVKSQYFKAWRVTRLIDIDGELLDEQDGSEHSMTDDDLMDHLATMATEELEYVERQDEISDKETEGGQSDEESVSSIWRDQCGDSDGEEKAAEDDQRNLGQHMKNAISRHSLRAFGRPDVWVSTDGSGFASPASRSYRIKRTYVVQDDDEDSISDDSFAIRVDGEDLHTSESPAGTNSNGSQKPNFKFTTHSHANCFDDDDDDDESDMGADSYSYSESECDSSSDSSSESNSVSEENTLCRTVDDIPESPVTPKSLGCSGSLHGERAFQRPDVWVSPEVREPSTKVRSWTIKRIIDIPSTLLTDSDDETDEEDNIKHAIEDDTCNEFDKGDGTGAGTGTARNVDHDARGKKVHSERDGKDSDSSSSRNETPLPKALDDVDSKNDRTPIKCNRKRIA